MIKYVIFDFDGTLVDSKEVFIYAFNKLAEKNKFNKLKHEDIEYLRKLSVMERCRFLDFPIYKMPVFAVEFYKIYKQSVSNIVLFDGIKELLSQLKLNGYNLAIISSNSEENIREFLQNNQIDSINEVFCSSNIFGKDKIIKKFLKAVKMKEADVIYVGDEHRDIDACKKTGVKVIWVKWGYDALTAPNQERPDYVAETPGDILKIVSEENAYIKAT